MSLLFSSELARSDAADVRGVDPVAARKFGVRLAAGPNFNKVIGGDLTAPIPVRRPAWRSLFARSVPIVVSARPDAQMRRIHTRRVVAGVKDHHSVGDGAFGSLIGVAMRPDGTFTGQKKYPVAIAVFAARPDPAAALGLLDAVIKYVLGTKKRVEMECPAYSRPAVAPSAQAPTYRLLVSALGAANRFLGVIGHALSPMTSTLCLFHGRSNFVI